MRKIVSLFAAAVFAATALIAVPGQAEAHRYHRGGGDFLAAAIIGGIAIAALSHRHHRHRYYSYYDDGYGYDYYPSRRYYSSYSYPSYGYGYYGGFRHHRHFGHW
jgi:hypothetical protein